MTVTVLNEGAESATIVSEAPDLPRRFQWSAVFAGAFVAAGVSFMLLTLGSGVGLSLVTVRQATAGGTITFLTLGAIYFLAAQAFGFAAGGHVVGRLIGPAVETAREEDFRAGAHGMVSWAIAVVATATVVALSVLVAGSAATNGAVNGTLAGASPSRGESTSSVTTSYWVDKLFRPATGERSAALAWRQYAQADTGATSDVPPSNESSATTSSDAPSNGPNGPSPSSTAGSPVFMNGDASASTTPPTPAFQPATRSLGADKAEAGRILTVGLSNGERLSAEDRTQLAQIVSNDTGISPSLAARRVDTVAGQIRADEVAAADAARKTAAHASLWTALALLFGAVVSTFAAISARWEDDRETGLGAAGR